MSIRFTKPDKRLALAAAAVLLGAHSASAQAPVPPVQGEKVFTYACPAPAAVAAPVVAPTSDIPPPPGPQVIARPEDFSQTPEKGRDKRGFPRWGDFPPPPQNVLTPADIKSRVGVITDIRNVYTASLSGLVWDLNDPVGYQAQTMARIDATKMAAIDPRSCQEIVDFALEKQKLATPPPIADN